MRNLIDFENSAALNLHNFDRIEELLAKGDNVVVLANHQTEADPGRESVIVSVMPQICSAKGTGCTSEFGVGEGRLVKGRGAHCRALGSRVELSMSLFTNWRGIGERNAFAAGVGQAFWGEKCICRWSGATEAIRPAR